MPRSDYVANLALTVSTAGMGAGFNSALGQWDRFGAQVNRRARSLTKGLGAITAAIGTFRIGRDVINTWRTFGQALSTVGAITGATGKQFVELEAEARRLGATTRFSATQVAEGMQFLARAGFDAHEVLITIEGSLKLAQAGALDLGRAADIASNVLQGMRLPVTDITRVLDVLTLQANRSNTTVSQLGDAFKFVAPVASGLGVSLEETSAAVGALSDAGLQATLAGTGLRRVMAELESPARKMIVAMEAVGVRADQVKVSQVGLATAIETLSDAGIGAGEALELFGQRGGPAFEVLADSIPKIREMVLALEDSGGTADNIARIMDDNLNGSLLRLRSRWESLILSLGKVGGIELLRGLVDGLTNTLRLLEKTFIGVAIVSQTIWLRWVDSLILGVGLLRPALESVGVELEDITNSLQAYRDLQQANIDFLVTEFQGLVNEDLPIGEIEGWIDIVGESAVLASRRLQSLALDWDQLIAAQDQYVEIVDGVSVQAKNLNANMDTLGQTIGEVDPVAVAFAKTMTGWSVIIPGLTTDLSTLIAAQDQYVEIVDGVSVQAKNLNANMDTLGQTIGEVNPAAVAFATAITGWSVVIPGLTANLSTLIAAQDQYVEIVDGISVQAKDLNANIDTLGQRIGEVNPAAVAFAKTMTGWSVIIPGLTTDLSTLIAGQDRYVEIVDGISVQAKDLNANMDTLGQTLGEVNPDAVAFATAITGWSVIIPGLTADLSTLIAAQDRYVEIVAGVVVQAKDLNANMDTLGQTIGEVNPAAVAFATAMTGWSVIIPGLTTDLSTLIAAQDRYVEIIDGVSVQAKDLNANMDTLGQTLGEVNPAAVAFAKAMTGWSVIIPGLTADLSTIIAAQDRYVEVTRGVSVQAKDLNANLDTAGLTIGKVDQRAVAFARAMTGWSVIIPGLTADLNTVVAAQDRYVEVTRGVSVQAKDLNANMDTAGQTLGEVDQQAVEFARTMSSTAAEVARSIRITNAIQLLRQPLDDFLDRVKNFEVELINAVHNTGGYIGNFLGGLLQQGLDRVFQALGVTWAQFWQFFDEAITPVLTALRPIVQALLPIMRDLAQILARVLTAVIRALGPAIVVLAEAFIVVLDALANLVIVVVEASAPAIQALAVAIADILIAVTPLIDVLADLLKPVLEAITPLIVLLAKVISAVAKILTPVIKLISELAGALGSLLGGGGGFLGGIIGGAFDLLGGLFGGLFHEGGTVPGAMGQEVLAVLQAGERVIPLNEVEHIDARRGSHLTVNIVQHVTGDVDAATLRSLRTHAREMAIIITNEQLAVA